MCFTPLISRNRTIQLGDCIRITLAWIIHPLNRHSVEQRNCHRERCLDSLRFPQFQKDPPGLKQRQRDRSRFKHCQEDPQLKVLFLITPELSFVELEQQQKKMTRYKTTFIIRTLSQSQRQGGFSLPLYY